MSCRWPPWRPAAAAPVCRRAQRAWRTRAAPRRGVCRAGGSPPARPAPRHAPTRVPRAALCSARSHARCAVCQRVVTRARTPVRLCPAVPGRARRCPCCAAPWSWGRRALLAAQTLLPQRQRRTQACRGRVLLAGAARQRAAVWCGVRLCARQAARARRKRGGGVLRSATERRCGPPPLIVRVGWCVHTCHVRHPRGVPGQCRPGRAPQAHRHTLASRVGAFAPQWTAGARCSTCIVVPAWGSGR
jgi:hypothetical protein